MTNQEISKAEYALSANGSQPTYTPEPTIFVLLVVGLLAWAIIWHKRPGLRGKMRLIRPDKTHLEAR